MKNLVLLLSVLLIVSVVCSPSADSSDPVGDLKAVDDAELAGVSQAAAKGSPPSPAQVESGVASGQKEDFLAAAAETTGTGGDRAEPEALRTICRESEIQLRQLQARLEAVQAEANTAEEEWNVRLEKAKAREKGLQDALLGKEAAIAAAEKKRMECETSLGAQSDERTALAGRLDSMIAERDRLTGQITVLRAELTQARGEARAAEKGLRQQLATLTAEKEKLATAEQEAIAGQIEREKRLAALVVKPSGESHGGGSRDDDVVEAAVDSGGTGADRSAGQEMQAAATSRAPQDRDLPEARSAALQGSPSARLSGETREAAHGVRTLVEDWARAWSEQKVEEYLSCYAADFQPADATSRVAWKNLRRSRVSSPKRIRVTLTDIEIEMVDSTTGRVRFVQSYRSDTYQDRMVKHLELKKEEGGWKIVREGG
ncbi:MAG: hypothetical protein AB1568_17000 [Thermodesulfobacteriota bacterium]